MKRWKLGTLPLTSVMIAAAAVVSAPPAVAGDPAPQRPAAEEPAAAGFDGSFDVFLRGGCGSVPTAYRAAITFVDSGPGVPGNDESNDDYVRIQDLCENGHGVKGWAWRNGKLLGSKYNGKGAFKPVIWDPYTRKKGTNVKEDDYVGIKICEVDGSGDSRPGPCDQDSRYSVDG